MFGKKETKEINTSKIDTLVGKNTTLEGKILTKGTIRLDGTLVGDLEVEGNAVIGEDGKIKGNIICHNIFISGIVQGNISSKEQLVITSTGKLYGDIEVKSFIVDENAIFEGTCKMQNIQTTKQTDNNKKTKKDMK